MAKKVNNLECSLRWEVFGVLSSGNAMIWLMFENGHSTCHAGKNWAMWQRCRWARGASEDQRWGYCLMWEMETWTRVVSMKVEVVRNGQCSDIFKDTYNLAYGLEDFQVLFCTVFLFTELGKAKEDQIRGRRQRTRCRNKWEFKKPVWHPSGDFEKLISQWGGTRGKFGAGVSRSGIMMG